MLDAPLHHASHSEETHEENALEQISAMDEVAVLLARSGMRIDRFVALATEGLLPDEDLRELWRKHRDVLLPDWAA